MVLEFKLRNVRQLEARIRAGAREYAGVLFKDIEKEAESFANSVVRAIITDGRFAELQSDPTLRGQLGMPRPELQLGGDTDADDLASLIRDFRIRTVLTSRTQNISISFPTIQELELKLTRSLSKVDKSNVIPGPQQSWFRWWEFGDRGEIGSLTVTKSIIGAAVTRTESGNRKTLSDLISERSRSGFGIQLPKVPAVGITIIARGLIRDVYDRFGRVFPARMNKALRRFVGGKGKSPSAFFAGARRI
jgi:hypothetical protein